MATLCALDCWHNLELSAEDLHIVTFGAPRVGNREFQKVYDDKISAHWRVVNAPDLIPSLPKVGYVHVGKKVLLTATGDLFLDPNTMEMSLWGKQAQSLLYHRKSSYLLAMKSWCRKHENGAYNPPFWKWPVSNDDSRRFPNAVGDMPNKKERSSTAGRKILHQDAMVDALGKEFAPEGYERVIMNWRRLTRRLLLHHQLSKAQ